MHRRPGVYVEVDRTVGGLVESVIAWAAPTKSSKAEARNDALAVMHLGAAGAPPGRPHRHATAHGLPRRRLARKTGRRERPFRRLPNG